MEVNATGETSEAKIPFLHFTCVCIAHFYQGCKTAVAVKRSCNRSKWSANPCLVSLGDTFGLREPLPVRVQHNKWVDSSSCMCFIMSSFSLRLILCKRAAAPVLWIQVPAPSQDDCWFSSVVELCFAFRRFQISAPVERSWAEGLGKMPFHLTLGKAAVGHSIDNMLGEMDWWSRLRKPDSEILGWAIRPGVTHL